MGIFPICQGDFQTRFITASKNHLDMFKWATERQLTRLKLCLSMECWVSLTFDDFLVKVGPIISDESAPWRPNFVCLP